MGAISTPKAPASSPVSIGNMGEEFDDDYEDGEGPDTQAALNRLKSLESEKARFEGLLSDSQKEHQELLERLNGMRSMMAMLRTAGNEHFAQRPFRQHQRCLNYH